MPFSPTTPRSCKNFDKVPFGASGIRQATVRIRKLVKLGTTTAASTMARQRSLTLNAAKYATGNPISKHSNVAVMAIRMVARNTVKNVSSNTST